MVWPRRRRNRSSTSGIPWEWFPLWPFCGAWWEGQIFLKMERWFVRGMTLRKTCIKKRNGSSPEYSQVGKKKSCQRRKGGFLKETHGLNLLKLIADRNRSNPEYSLQNALVEEEILPKTERWFFSAKRLDLCDAAKCITAGNRSKPGFPLQYAL